MDNATLQAIRGAVEKHNVIGIVVGRNPNLDSMAASLSLYLSLRQLGKNVTVASPSEPIVEISSLVGIDKVKTSLSGDGGDLIVSFPYREGEIEKVSYTLENGLLNIIVKAGEDGLSFDEKEVKYKREGSLPTLLFVVGTPRLSDLGNLFDPSALKDTTVVNVDNKQENQGFGDIVYVSAKFSSLSEMVGDALSTLGVTIDVDIAQNLLSGISFATNNFQDTRTSYLAFEMAAMLLRQGALRPKAGRPAYQAGESGLPSTVQEGPSFRPRQPMQQQGDYRQQPQRSPVQQQRQQFPRKTQIPQQQMPQQGQPQQKTDEEAPADWLTPKVYKGSNLG